MITNAQIRAARALLGWKQTELATAARLSEMSVKNIERGDTDPRVSTLHAIKSALETAGIRFIDGNYSGSGGPGVRLAAPTGASIDVNESQTVQYEEHLTNDAPPGAGG
ncbi:helix-turn-helix transcriptional regulator [Rhizobium sp. YAF28]|uniref:helix-turn-helix transcriptional regulator n=1 Tax=Rhizobium sp. YAF28 TaxID=3233081 RepID=UPI003F9B651E